MYSGHVAGAVYRRLELPERYVILCPNHTGMGEPLAIMSEGAWHTPLGDADIDEGLRQNSSSTCRSSRRTTKLTAPNTRWKSSSRFCKSSRRDFDLFPSPSAPVISMCWALSASQSEIRWRNERQPLSRHRLQRHEPLRERRVTRVKDRRAIDPMLALDPRGLYDAVRDGNISMCGYGPAVVMLTAAKKLGATQAELVRYATSGDVSNDRDTVVGYAGIAVY